MDTVQITFHPMTTEVGGANPVHSPIFDVSGFAKLIVFLNTEDIRGTTPSISVSIDDSMDGLNWRVAGTVASTAVGVMRAVVSDFGRFVRATFTYAGTDPEGTFSVLALAREF